MRFRLRDILLLMLMAAAYLTSFRIIHSVIEELEIGSGIYILHGYFAVFVLLQRVEKGLQPNLVIVSSHLQWHVPMPWFRNFWYSLSMVACAWLTRYFRSPVGLALFLLVSMPFLIGFVDLLFPRQVILEGQGILFKKTLYPWSRIQKLKDSNGRIVRLSLHKTQSSCVIDVPKEQQLQVADFIGRHS